MPEWLHRSHRRAKSDLAASQTFKNRSSNMSPSRKSNMLPTLNENEQARAERFKNRRASQRSSMKNIRRFNEGRNVSSPHQTLRKSRSEVFGVRRTVKFAVKHAIGKKTLNDEVEEMARRFEDAGIPVSVVADGAVAYLEGESAMPESKLLQKTKQWLGDIEENSDEEEFQGKEKHNRRLWHAAALGNDKMVQNCIRDGKCGLNSQDETGATALFLASFNGHADVVRSLLESGAKHGTVDARGKSPLMRAAFNGHSDILKMLVSAGADVNLQSKSGWTALMYATARGNLKSVAVLCDCGADPTLKTYDGKTAANIADQLRSAKGPDSYSSLVSRVLLNLIDDRVKRRSLLAKE